MIKYSLLYFTLYVYLPQVCCIRNSALKYTTTYHFLLLHYYPYYPGERSRKFTRVQPLCAKRIDTSRPINSYPLCVRRRTNPIPVLEVAPNFVRRQETRWTGGANKSKCRSNLNSAASQASNGLSEVIGHFIGGDSLPSWSQFAALSSGLNS